MSKLAKKPEKEEEEAVQVAVRVRPKNEREKRDPKAVTIVNMTTLEVGSRTTISNPAKPEEEHPFDFDYSFQSMDESLDDFADQDSVYNALGAPVFQYALEGRNVCLFAYGQTGSGKSFSMLGAQGAPDGIVPKVCRGLFKHITDNAGKEKCTVDMRVFEVYMEKVNNLLLPHEQWPPNGFQLRMTPSGAFEVPQDDDNARPWPCESYDDTMKVIGIADANRSMGSHSLNSNSSRAHTVYAIRFTREIIAKKEVTRSTLNLIDLAGSEKSDAAGTYGKKEFEEGNAINLSLSQLGNCIHALSLGKTPNYRNSKLTLLLKGSLENGRVIMIAALSPSSLNYEETLSTLRFAKRIKTVKVKSRRSIFSDPVEAAKAEMEEHRARLQREIDELMAGGAGMGGGAIGMTEEEKQALEERLEEQRDAKAQAEAILQRRINEARQSAAEREARNEAMMAEWKRTLGGMKALGVPDIPDGPALMNVTADARLSGTLVYALTIPTPGKNVLGRKEGKSSAHAGHGGSGTTIPVTIAVNGFGVLPNHAILEVAPDAAAAAGGHSALYGARVFVTPVTDPSTGTFARCLVNGHQLTGRTEVHHNARLWVGHNCVFRVNIPGKGADVDPNVDIADDSEITYDLAMDESSRVSSELGGDVPLTDDLRRKLTEVLMTVERVNLQAHEMFQSVVFEARLLAHSSTGGEGCTHDSDGGGGTHQEVFVKAIYPTINASVLLTNVEFDNLSALIQQQYAQFQFAAREGVVWAPPPEADDPFRDSAQHLVGEAYVSLAPILHRVAHTARVNILSLEGSIVAGPWSGVNAALDPFVVSPNDLIGAGPFKCRVRIVGLLYVDEDVAENEEKEAAIKASLLKRVEKEREKLARRANNLARTASNRSAAGGGSELLQVPSRSSRMRRGSGRGSALVPPSGNNTPAIALDGVPPDAADGARGATVAFADVPKVTETNYDAMSISERTSAMSSFGSVCRDLAMYCNTNAVYRWPGDSAWERTRTCRKNASWVHLNHSTERTMSFSSAEEVAAFKHQVVPVQIWAALDHAAASLRSRGDSSKLQHETLAIQQLTLRIAARRRERDELDAEIEALRAAAAAR